LGQVPSEQPMIELLVAILLILLILKVAGVL
jgi:hypothetical protein